jgi:hypothetical protein
MSEQKKNEGGNATQHDTGWIRPVFLRVLYTVGLTNLSNNEVQSYTQRYEQEHKPAALEKRF